MRDEKAQPESVQVQTPDAALSGDLTTPANAVAIALFAHGSGSSRLSSRNRFVASELNSRGIATLLFDLLTETEDKVDQVTREHRFDIPLPSKRLVGAIDWLAGRADVSQLPVALFGASTGAAAALNAAASRSQLISSVISRGGRPDLAPDALSHVRAPTLLIVGESDEPVIEMNRSAARLLRCEHTVEIVPGATHLFEEPGALEQVSALAGDWILRHAPSD
ncbi:MAG: dienelactone hydrolase family protein [Planctomycetota bacterium]|nr:dienelactone hydrolase family protein [Planctomycetota bacterium]